MASSFPGAIDSFTDPLSGSPLNSPSHSAQHADLNDAVEKVETYMGLVKVSSGTVSVQANFDITGFSALYNRYKLICSFQGNTVTNTLTCQVANGATVRTTAYYGANWFVNYLSSSGVNSAVNAGSNFSFMACDPATENYGSFEIQGINTSASRFFMHQQSFGPTDARAITGSFYRFTADANDRLRITCSTSTVSGSWALYGYRI